MGSTHEGRKPSLKSLAVAFLVAGLLWDVAEAKAANTWDYGKASNSGPKKWSQTYPDCGGNMQSPVDIDTKHVVYDPNLEYFDFSDYAKTIEAQMKLENVGGHTAEVVVTGKSIYIKNGSLPAKYILEQFHFHWGFNGSRGSEHSINRQFAPLEVHFVHRQELFPNISVAASHPFGLAVVAFYFQIGKENTKYETLLDNLTKIRNANDETEIEPFSILDLILPSNFDFYRYLGSLTTPPCYESVIWSIAVNPIEISDTQLEKFRSLRNEHSGPLVDDFRPTQPLNHRTILTTVQSKTSPAAQ